ncbi:unnamed protein product, partial [Chrysoparadoxa australica]
MVVGGLSFIPPPLPATIRPRWIAQGSVEDELMQWVKDQGAYVMEGLELADLWTSTKARVGHRGVRSFAAIESGSTLVRVPWEATLTVLEGRSAEVQPSPLPKSFVDPNVWCESRWYTKMALWLLYEKSI